MKLTYFGTVDENGILKLTNKQGFADDLKDFIGEVKITLERKSKRSLSQNNYFHAVCIPIIKAHLLDLGWKEAKSNEWVKDYIKFKCLVKEFVNEETGETMKSLGKTSELSKDEFVEFVQDVQRFAAEELGLYVPDPGEQTSIEL